MLSTWSDAVSNLVEEIRAQAQRFAQAHLSSDDAPALITRVDDPDIPGQFTFLVEQFGEPLVLIVVDSNHVLEEAAKVSARPGLILEGIRRSARMVYLDPCLAGHLRAALSRTKR